MALFYIDSTLVLVQHLKQTLDRLAAEASLAGAEIVEVQARKRDGVISVFLVLDVGNIRAAQYVVQNAGLDIQLLKAVQLVQHLCTTPQRVGTAGNHLPGLSMDAYLGRKYDTLSTEVPQAPSERVYVCEDMSISFCSQGNGADGVVLGAF